MQARALAFASLALLALPVGCSDEGAASSRAGLTISSDSGVAVTFELLEGTANVAYEGGRSLRIGVRLSEAPASDVVVRLASSLPNEATVEPATLRITPSQWETAIPVLVSAIDDTAQDGIVPFVLQASVLVSDDARYQGAATTSYRLYTVDNDRAGVIVTPITDPRTTESGGAVAFDVKLAVEPSADVRVNLQSSNEKEGTVLPTRLDFGKSNWAVGQRILVRGVDDAVADGDVAYTLALAVTSGDLEYSSLHPAPVALTNADDEVQAPIVDAPPSGLVVEERTTGFASELWVRLRARPMRPVLVHSSVDSTAPVRLDPPVVGFSPEAWDVPQKVRVLANGAAPSAADVPFTVRISLVSEGGDSVELPGTMRGSSGS